MVTRSYWIRSSGPLEQIRNLIIKLDLSNLTDPLTRCLNCNEKLVPVEKSEISHRLQALIAKYYFEFFQCLSCDQIYWEGSHFENMVYFIQQYLLYKE